MDPGMLREVALAVYDKIAPAIGQAISSPTVAIASSAFTLATWILMKSGRLRGKHGGVDEEEAMIRVYLELQRSKKMLEESKEAGAPEEAVKALEDRVRWLEEEYQLLQVRIAAKDALEAFGGKELAERLEKILHDIDRGKERSMGELVDILREVENRWRMRQLEAQALRRLLDQRVFS